MIFVFWIIILEECKNRSNLNMLSFKDTTVLITGCLYGMYD